MTSALTQEQTALAKEFMADFVRSQISRATFRNYVANLDIDKYDPAAELLHPAYQRLPDEEMNRVEEARKLLIKMERHQIIRLIEDVWISEPFANGKIKVNTLKQDDEDPNKIYWHIEYTPRPIAGIGHMI